MTKAVSIQSERNPVIKLKRTLLNYASLQENSNKFYIVELQEGTSEANFSFRLYTEYGRLGRDPRKDGRDYRNQEEAERAYAQLVSSKCSRGYHPIEEDNGEQVSADTSVLSSFLRRNRKRGTDDTPSIREPIGMFYQKERTDSPTSTTTPFKLSSKQLDKGFEVLHKIEVALETNTKEGIERLTDEFYTLIPVIFGNKVDVNRFLINDEEKVQEKKELLTSMMKTDRFGRR